LNRQKNIEEKFDLKWRNDEQDDDCKIVIVEHYQGTLVTISCCETQNGVQCQLRKCFFIFLVIKVL